MKQVISLAYPMSDVIMVSVVIILIALAGHSGRIRLQLVMAGVVAFAVSDSAFAYLTEVNKYNGGSFFDVGWVAGYLLIALGAHWALTSPSPDVSTAEQSAISLVAPYVPVLVVLGCDRRTSAARRPDRHRLVGNGILDRGASVLIQKFPL